MSARLPSIRHSAVSLGTLALLAAAASGGYALVATDDDTMTVTERVVPYEDPVALTEMNTPDLPPYEPYEVIAAGEVVDEAPQAASAVDPAAVWDRLADCESGDWVDGWPQPGTARWDYGLTFSHGDSFEGGLNFHPGTWDAFKDPGMPDHAGNATRAQQIMVGERVRAAQGWDAWPVCSGMLGLG